MGLGYRGWNMYLSNLHMAKSFSCSYTFVYGERFAPFVHILILLFM